MYKLRILIVEDDPDDLALIEQMLYRSSYFQVDTRTTDDEKEYQHLIATFNPDVILADYRLPRFSGLDALKICLHNSPLTRFIFVTGAISKELAVETVLTGAWGFVLKENITELNEVIHTCVTTKDALPPIFLPIKASTTSARLRKQIELNKQALIRAKSFLKSHGAGSHLKKDLEQQVAETQREIEEIQDHLENS